jgi:hypothetical protein
MPMVPLGETVVILERLAEGHLTRRLFGAIVRRLGMLGGPAGWQPAIVAANEDEKGAEGDMSEKSVASATMPGVGVSDGPEQPFMGPSVTLVPEEPRWTPSTQGVQTQIMEIPAYRGKSSQDP